MDVVFGGGYYQACYANINGMKELVTFCGDEPYGNPSLIEYAPGSSCETCVFRVGAGVEQRVITAIESRPFRHLALAPWDSVAFTTCSRVGISNPAGICPRYELDENVHVVE